MSIKDTAVGAILEIPSKAMARIKQANDALITLHESSVKAANQIYGDFNDRIPRAFDKFIQKINEAKDATKGIGNINITLNTNAAVQAGQQLSTQMQRTSNDVAKAAQDMAQLDWSRLAKVDISKVDLVQLNTLEKLRAELERVKTLRETTDKDRSVPGLGTPQDMTNYIRQIEEVIRLWQLSATEKNKAVSNIAQKQQNEKDKAYLDEQKRLLERILQLRKDISQISISVQRGTITGKTDMSADLVQLEKLRKELRETGWAYRDLRTFQSQTISEDAKIKAEIQSQNAKNAGLRQEVDERNKLNAAITCANEWTAQGQQGKSRLGSGEEASIQRQLNSDYKKQLAILKEIGEIKAKAAEQGKTLTINSAEVQLIQALAQRYRVYAEDVNRVAGAYRAMGEAAAKNFAADRSEQLARNAIMLAYAQKKSETSTKHLAVEYKKLDAEFQKLNKSLDQYNDKVAGKQMAPAQGQALDASANAIVYRMADVATRMREIERKNIDEVNAYRQQKDMEANQKSISDFIQAEAQKKAAALQTAQEESEARKRALQTYLQSYQGAMQQADKIMSGRSGTSMFATNLENIKRAINDLKAASGNLNLLNPADVQKAEQLKKKIAELEALMKRYKDAATPDKPVISPQDAINAAKNATTLKQLEKAYRDLKEAMSGVDSSKPIWTQMNIQLRQTKQTIDDIKKKMGEFHNETQRTSNMMGNLQNRIAAAFSVSAILGFAKKVTEVRAQFELQRVALGAIIQDKDEANKVFLRVQQMALESPFSIMQLERATKQVAAFGFEAKSLVPTMKMVADIGAGLGVELDRIVLVLGHMKARGYLEGTMVRQFTNMGFNVLGELAKYYTELEGRMVSVADVQERVKKKMVEFGDVEEVLKRVTSAGGMFYDMQKKQSDSIWGQMQRITDAYDLMLNEIGQSNEGSIKAALTAIRTLINSWRTLAPIIVSTVASVGSFFTVSIAMKVLPKVILGMSTAMQLFRKQITIAEIQARGLNTALLSNPYAAITAAVVGLGVAILQVATAQSKLNEELERTQSEGISDMYGLIFQYRTLSETVKDSTKSYKERKKALDEIKRVYKDILPDYMTEVEYIKSIKDGYEEATNAIKAYSEAKIRKNMQDAIDTEFGKQIQDAITNTAGIFSSILKVSGILPDDMDRRTIQGAITNIMMGIAEEVKAGTLKQEEVNKQFKERFKKTFNLTDEDITSSLSLRRWFAGWDEDLQKVFDDMFDKLGETTTLGLTSTVLDERAKPAVNQFHELEKAVSEYTAALEALYKRKNELEKQGGVFGQISVGEVGGKKTITFPGADSVTQDAMDEVDQKLAILQGQVKKYGETFTVTTQDINTALQSNMDQTEYLGTVNQNVLQRILNNFNKWGWALTQNDFMRNFVENALKNLSLLTEPQKNIINIARKVATANGIAMNSFDLLEISAAASYTDAAKEAKKLSDQAADNILKIHATKMKLIELGWTAEAAQEEAEKYHGGDMTEDELKKYQKTMEDMWKALGGYEKKSKKKSGRDTDKELKRWQDLKKAIEDVSTAYDKARKSFSVEESNRQIEKLFGQTFKELGADIQDFYKNGTYDAESLIDALEVLLGTTKATTEERKKFRSEMQRSMADTQVEIDVKLKEDSEKKLKDDLDRMFDNYELSKTFKDIGLNVDLTYMVGGKPTTIEDIRNEIDRLRKEGGGTSDAENRIKILKEAEKKLTQIELKEQRERLKNYEKYLKQMYSNRAKTMIESYTTMMQMEEDFQKNIKTLESEMAAPNTTEARKKELAGLISTLKLQAKEAATGIQRELSESMAKADWNSFKGNEIFESMYQDLDTLTKKGIDALIQRLEMVRDKLQSVSNIDPKAVREVTQYIEKLKDARINLAPYSGFKDALQAAKDLKKEYGSIEAAQLRLVELNDSALGYEQEVADLETIIGCLDRKVEIQGVDEATTARLNNLYAENKNDLQGALVIARENLKTTKDQAAKLSTSVDNAKKLGAAYQAQISLMQKYRESTEQITDSVFAIADALGGEVDEEWKNLASSIINAVFQGIQLQLQMQILQVQAQLLGVAMNSALGIIGWVAIALQVVASLLTAIFAAKDKGLQKKIEKLQDRVDALSKSYERLQKSIKNAMSISVENRMTEQALDNLEAQKRAYSEMIRLEQEKKKTDEDKIKEWTEKMQELNEAGEELYEKRHEKWGSTNSVWDEANNWVDAWLNAYKETGDGLDALNQSWDDFYANLVKKQAASAVFKNRMDKWIKEINDAIDKNMGSEYSYIDLFKSIGERMKADFEATNEDLKRIFEYAGIGGTGEFVLSDLQKGIQNITEPQAAAIEAYLNSMRFAVFRHTEQLDSLIAIVGAQYGVGIDNPVVTELKGIRIVLDTIDRRLDSVIETKAGIGTVLKIG